jgi:hypothetical protein
VLQGLVAMMSSRGVMECRSRAIKVGKREKLRAGGKINWTKSK